MEVFTDEEIEYLINLVSQNPSLFDSKNANHKDLILKDNIWRKIAEVLNKTSENCKKQWKVIRDGYIRFKRKNNLPTGKEALKSNRTKWQIYRKLSFLDASYRKRPNTDDIDVSSHIQDSESAPNTAEESEESTREYPSSAEKTQQKQFKKQKRMRDKDDVLFEYLQARDESHFSYQQNTDDVNSFANHVEHVLKKLPPILQIIAKREIFEVVTKFELIAAEEINVNVKLEQ